MPNGTSNSVAWAEHIINCYIANSPDGPSGDNFGAASGFNIAVDHGGDIDNPCFGCPTAFEMYGTCIGYNQGFANGTNILFQVMPPTGNCWPDALSTAHSGGMMVGLGDGSVRIVTPGISYNTWYAVCYTSSGIPAGPDW